MRLPAVDPYKPMAVTDFGYGIMDSEAPTQVPRGAALISFDADYDNRNIQNRAGYKAVLENGPGAVKVADFEAGEAWAGGAAEAGADNFVLVEAAADGTQGRKLTATGGAGEVVMTLVVALDLGTIFRDVFHVWMKTLTKDAGITGYTATLRFTTSGGNHYQITIASEADAQNEIEAGRGKYHRFRRHLFAATGTPDWQNITEIRFGLTATGTGSLVIAFDNLHRTPGLMQDLFQFRRQSGSFAGAMDEYAVTGGVLYRNDRRRWAQVATGLDSEMPVYSITSMNRRILSDGKTSPRLLMDDGATVYRLGIVTPPRTVVAAQLNLGGGLPDGTYYVQVLWFSSKTGAFSAPDDRVPATGLVITGGANQAGIRFTNIPVSADPQVDWVIVGIRPDTEPELFYRITDGTFGDVANGTTTVDYTGNLTDLLARARTAIDPDMDYPSVVDENGVQVEGHPTLLSEAGGYILTVMAEQPTVVRFSRFRSPTSWALDDEAPLGENDSDPVTGIGVEMSSIFAFKRTGVYAGRVVGGDVKIVFDAQISDSGSVEHKSILSRGGRLWYRGPDGIYVLERDQVPIRITTQAQNTWDETWSEHSEGWGAVLLNRDRDQIVHFGRKPGELHNGIGWVTHFRSEPQAGPKKWPTWAPTLHRMPAEVAAEVKAPAGWEPWIGGNGQVFRANYGHEDDGRPIETVHRTVLWSPNPHFVHNFQYLDIEAMCSGQASLDVRSYMGTAIDSDGNVVADLKGNADVLGSFVLGTDQIGVPRYVHQKLRLPPRPVRYVHFEFRFRARSPMAIYRASVWSKPFGALRATQ